MKKIKTGDKILVPFEVLDIQDTGDYPYSLGYGTARIHASAEMLERFRQETGGEDHEKTYEDGRTDAWKMAKKMFLYPHEGGYSSEELEEIFGRTEHLWELTPQETAAKIAEWESRQAICVGDLVRAEFGYGVVTNVHKEYCYVLWIDGSSGCKEKKFLTKTGHTIDIAGLLEQIGDGCNA